MAFFRFGRRWRVLAWPRFLRQGPNRGTRWPAAAARGPRGSDAANCAPGRRRARAVRHFAVTSSCRGGEPVAHIARRAAATPSHLLLTAARSWPNATQLQLPGCCRISARAKALLRVLPAGQPQSSYPFYCASSCPAPPADTRRPRATPQRAKRPRPCLVTAVVRGPRTTTQRSRRPPPQSGAALQVCLERFPLPPALS
jgi:hypothetical protein